MIYAQRQEDTDGFVQMYVPKDAILTEEVVAQQKGRKGKTPRGANAKVGYIYQKKQQAKDGGEERTTPVSASKDPK